MLKTFRIFFGTEGTNPLLILFCLFTASIAEAMSLGALVPTAAALSGQSGNAASGVTAYINGALTAIGVTPSLGTLVILVASAMILKSAFSFVALSYAGISAAGVAMSFRRRLITSVFGARWSSYADNQAGRFAHAISSDTASAGEAYLQSAQVVAFSLQVVAYVVIAFVIDWRLAMLGMGAAVLLSLVARVLIKRAKAVGRKQTERTEAITTYMLDMLTNIKAVKSMQRAAPMLNDLKVLMRRLKDALVMREITRAGLSQGSDALIAVFAAAGLYLAGTVWKVSLPEMVVSSVIFLQVVSIVSKLQRMLQNAVILQAAYVNASKLVAEVEAAEETWAGTVKPELGQGCRFEGVTFGHGAIPVVEDVSFDIPAKAITVLMGPSGAGKTTLIDLLIGLYTPKAGTIFVGDTPLPQVDVKAWRSLIGYVPQELSLAHTSIRRNITLGDDAITDEMVKAALAKAGALDFVMGLPDGLDTDVGEMGGKLSGGQRQRISLARALVGDPKVLILDEVTSALDPETEAGIVENIARLGHDYTTIAITHRPAWTRIADRLYEVAGGQVTAVSDRSGATLEAVLARPQA